MVSKEARKTAAEEVKDAKHSKHDSDMHRVFESVTDEGGLCWWSSSKEGEAGGEARHFPASSPRPFETASLSKKFWDAAGMFTTPDKKKTSLHTPFHAQPVLLLFEVA